MLTSFCLLNLRQTQEIVACWAAPFEAKNLTLTVSYDWYMAAMCSICLLFIVMCNGNMVNIEASDWSMWRPLIGQCV